MEENKNDIDELVKSIDSSFEEMSLKDIVAAHENYFGADDISFDKDKTEEEKKKEKAKVLKDDGKIDKAELLENLKENETKDKNDKTEMSEEQKQNIREMKVKKTTKKAKTEGEAVEKTEEEIAAEIAAKFDEKCKGLLQILKILVPGHRHVVSFF